MSFRSALPSVTPPTPSSASAASQKTPEERAAERAKTAEELFKELAHAEAPVEVGVDEEGPHGREYHERHLRRIVAGEGLQQAEGVERDEAAHPGEQQVERVGPRVDHEVDFGGAVVDGMEAPEEGDFMQQAVAPVATDLAEHVPGGFSFYGKGKAQPTASSFAALIGRRRVSHA